jgi:hypothetical protein
MIAVGCDEAEQVSGAQRQPQKHRRSHEARTAFSGGKAAARSIQGRWAALRVAASSPVTRVIVEPSPTVVKAISASGPDKWAYAGVCFGIVFFWIAWHIRGLIEVEELLG